ncbi:hypothetical protein NLG97_g8775 [Lecanicillium saksenae]|uniref:Uncharacterized protein n=1 Tax=Lecanicillium saksenae TaxID=468837 RepID=A0ACC1QL96_9HYPO|nr:hypothetical protein NLG97_g8775 [Lecanicillium saksenae]
MPWADYDYLLNDESTLPMDEKAIELMGTKEGMAALIKMINEAPVHEASGPWDGTVMLPPRPWDTSANGGGSGGDNGGGNGGRIKMENADEGGQRVSRLQTIPRIKTE